MVATVLYISASGLSLSSTRASTAMTSRAKMVVLFLFLAPLAAAADNTGDCESLVGKRNVTLTMDCGCVHENEGVAVYKRQSVAGDDSSSESELVWKGRTNLFRLERLTASDGGTFRCSCLDGSAAKCYEIYVKPYISKCAVSPLAVHSGNGFTAKCVAHAYPPPETCNIDMTPYDGVTHTVVGSTVESIYSYNGMSSGQRVFRCLVGVPSVGSSLVTAHLFVYDQPKILAFIMPDQDFRNETVFECRVQNNSIPVEIRFQKNNRFISSDIPEGKYHTHCSRIGATELFCQLRILDTSPSDNGVYSCWISTKFRWKEDVKHLRLSKFGTTPPTGVGTTPPTGVGITPTGASKDTPIGTTPTTSPAVTGNADAEGSKWLKWPLVAAIVFPTLFVGLLVFYLVVPAVACLYFVHKLRKKGGTSSSIPTPVSVPDVSVPDVPDVELSSISNVSNTPRLSFDSTSEENAV